MDPYHYEKPDPNPYSSEKPRGSESEKPDPHPHHVKCCVWIRTNVLGYFVCSLIYSAISILFEDCRFSFDLFDTIVLYPTVCMVLSRCICLIVSGLLPLKCYFDHQTGNGGQGYPVQSSPSLTPLYLGEGIYTPPPPHTENASLRGYWITF
jgi:hypothetical protein